MRFPTIEHPATRRKVLRYIRTNGSITNRESRRLLGIGYDEAIALFNSLVRSGNVVRIGKTSGTKYVLPHRH